MKNFEKQKKDPGGDGNAVHDARSLRAVSGRGMQVLILFVTWPSFTAVTVTGDKTDYGEIPPGRFESAPT